MLTYRELKVFLNKMADDDTRLDDTVTVYVYGEYLGVNYVLQATEDDVLDRGHNYLNVPDEDELEETGE